MELHEIEELIKSVDRKAMAAVMRSAAILKNPKATPEMKAQALENIKAISGSPAQSREPQRKIVQYNSMSDLNSALSAGESKIKEITNSKIKNDLNRIQQNKDEQKKQLAAERKAQLKQAQVKQEQLDRIRTTFLPEEVSPEQQAKRDKVTVGKALDLAHSLHGDGETDHAHKILSSIPKEHLPEHLKDYNPTYIHYNVSPDLWKQLPKDNQDHVHSFHNEIISGAHDNHPDERTRGMATKVKNLLKPPVS